MRNFVTPVCASPYWTSLVTIVILAGLTLIGAPLLAKESSRRTPVVLAVEKVSPAVVNISTIVQERVRPFFPFHGEDFFKDFFPEFFSREYTRSSLGSGLIVDGKKGHVVTNHHVVARATEIKVITADEREFKARLLGSDPRSDLAVLQIASDQKFPEVRMGNSDDLMIGETVIAIGNPFGLSHTVTTGVVSALDRSVRAEETIYRHFIQTDASINPGNSGGPLLNIEGEVIGINTAIYQKAQGIGFAIPINKVGRIVKELLRAGEVRAPWLGLELQELTDGLRKSFAFPGKMKGLLVNDVYRDGPAARAGIRRGDILVRMEGMAMGSLEEYRGNLSEYTPGDRLRLGVFRKGEEIGLSVQPSSFPLELAVEMVDRRMGIRVAGADQGTKRQYGIKDGVVIDKVRQGSEAARIGLQPGDLVLKVNETAVSGLEDFQKAISAYHHLSSLTLFIRRGPYGFSITLAF
ncbi:MAG: Do family serine endopeptidase [Deltaproteobacteria bacterium]|nr:Do family serine endopeptidase [Deltaproteobacteria bacterium]